MTTTDPKLNSVSLPFELGKNFPDPFVCQTIIPFTLFSGGQVCLAIYDMTGRKVRTLINAWLEPEEYEMVLNKTQLSLLPGIYTCQLIVNVDGRSLVQSGILTMIAEPG